jgi:hypothetical protein
MNLTKTSLLEAMKKCLPGVEKGSSLIEGADAFLFDGTHIHTYNDNIAVSVPVALDGMTGAVKAMDFFRLVSKLNVPLIQVSVAEGKLTFQAGRTKASLVMINTQVEGYVKELDLAGLEWLAIPTNFHEGIRLCKMSSNPTPLRGICVEGDQMASTDSARINSFRLSSEMGSFWLDDPVISELMKLGSPVQYAIRGAWFHAKLTDGTMFSCKRKDHTQFPSAAVKEQVEAITKAKTTGIQNRLPKALSEAVDRVSTMASGLNATSSLVRLTLRKDELELYTTKAFGDAEETVPWETPFESDPNLRIWVESGFLTEAAKKVMDFHVVNMAEPAPEPAEGEEPAEQEASLPALVFSSSNYTQLASTDPGV